MMQQICLLLVVSCLLVCAKNYKMCSDESHPSFVVVQNEDKDLIVSVYAGYHDNDNYGQIVFGISQLHQNGDLRPVNQEKTPWCYKGKCDWAMADMIPKIACQATDQDQEHSVSVLDKPTDIYYRGTLSKATFVPKTDKCDRLLVRWPKLGITSAVAVPLCASDSSTALTAVTACAPAFIDSQDRPVEEYITSAFTTWVDYIVYQVGAIQIFTTSSSAPFLDAAKKHPLSASMLKTGALKITDMDVMQTYYDMGARDYYNGQDNGKGRPMLACANDFGEVMWTKCLLELKGSTEWVMLMDIDEGFFTSNPKEENMTTFLTGLDNDMQQYLFCEKGVSRKRSEGDHHHGDCYLDEPSPNGRPKSAVRVNNDCLWDGFAHFAFNNHYTPEHCKSNNYAPDGKGKHMKVSDYFKHFSTQDGGGPGCFPVPPQGISHDRINSPGAKPGDQFRACKNKASDPILRPKKEEKYPF